MLFFASVFAFSGCDLFGGIPWDDHQVEDAVFYGVGAHIDDLNNTCVFVPRIGHVSMPNLKEGEKPSFKEGDLIEMIFKKSGDIAILESFPAQFGAPADEINVKSASIELEYGDCGFLITLDTPENLSDIRKGDSLVMKTKVADSGYLDKEYAAFTVSEATSERMTLSFDVTADELLKELMYSEYRFEKIN